MSLNKLTVSGVRNIQQLSLTPSSGLNFIYGSNGSGKSSLLEAIYVLGRARSFRSNTIKHVINHQASELVVTGQALQKNGLYAHLGVQHSATSCDIRINQGSKSLRAELAYAFPIQLIHPVSFQLLDGSSVYRREFLDWGVFNDDEHFLALWRRFKKSLAQRNVLLKSGALHQIHAWDHELVRCAIPVSKVRAEYVQKLEPVFLDICHKFLCVEGIQLSFFSGWNDQKDLQLLLADSIERDCRYGFTQFGPHRADFRILIDSKLAKDFVSRGELKLLVLALKLAQVQLMQQKFSKIGCILIDDLVAEIDLINRGKLLSYLAAMGVQVFLTANERNEFGDLSGIIDFTMFHVEHGAIK